MSVLLLSIGILVSLIGLFAIGFSIPIHEFSLGNTLMTVGAIATVGGLVIVGLGAVVSELRKVARLLEHPRMARPPVPEAGQGRRPPAVPAPPKAAVPAKPPRPVPDRVEPPPVVEMPRPAERPAERPRPDIFALTRAAGEAAAGAEHAAPLFGAPPPPVAEARRADIDETVPVSAPESAGEAAAPPLPLRPSLGPETLRPPPVRPAEPPARNLFDTVWPTESIPTPEAVFEAAAQRARSERYGLTEAPPRLPPRQEPTAAGPVESEAKPVSILKSGVVDGMAYTLYTDGSIEAQLPQGIVRFASIDELRAHLEKHG